MAVDRNRLAAALAYEEERRRRLANVVPVPASGQPEVAPTPSLRSNLENLSIGLGEGLTNQLEGVRALVTDPIGSAKGAYEGVVAAVRDPSIIADALRYTAQQAASGPLGAGEVIGEMVGPMRTRGTPVMQEIDVYHGSPHRFEEFDASKIGTGEGAQAYGHGIYLAESPDVAREYQVRLSYDPEKMKIGGKQINAVYNQLQDAAARMPPARAAAEYEKLDLIERLMMNNPVDEVEKAAADLSPATQKWFAKQVKPSFETYGSFYKADLPDEMVDRMLDWDKPLSQQSPAVRETVMRYMNVGEKQLPADMRVGQIGDKFVVLQDNPPLPGSTFGIGRSIVKGPRAASEQEAIDAYWNSLTGKDFYDTIGKDLGKNADASDYMRQLGIPGIKYMDEGSRGYVVDLFHKGKPYSEHQGIKYPTLQSAQERIAEAQAEGFEPRLGTRGTRNFVVFPGEEKKVSILERDGKKLASALKATAAQKQDVEVNLYPVRNQPNVMYLSKIEVTQGQRGQGIGSSVMRDIINQADADGKTITLTPSTAYGATSTKRLKDFYKRFGFVENSGRNKNYALNETMYRLPRKPKE